MNPFSRRTPKQIFQDTYPHPNYDKPLTAGQYDPYYCSSGRIKSLYVNI